MINAELNLAAMVGHHRRQRKHKSQTNDFLTVVTLLLPCTTMGALYSCFETTFKEDAS